MERESGHLRCCPKTEGDTGSLKVRWMEQGRTEGKYVSWDLFLNEGSKRERESDVGMREEMIIGPRLQACVT